MRALTAGLVLMLGLLGSPGSAQQDEAVRLYDEARALVEQAENAEDSFTALPLLERARRNLQAIIEQHPGSATASRIVLGDPLQRRLNAATIEAREQATTERAETEALARSCVQQPTADCLFDLARSIARWWLDADLRTEVLRDIAVAQTEAGQFDAALSTARGIEHAGGRAETLSRVAVAQVGAEQIDAATQTFDAALSTAHGVEDAFWRGWALGRIAADQAEAGQLDAALSTARGIEHARSRAMALGRIAAAQSEVGQLDAAARTFDAALSVARGIDDTSSRAMALSQIAVAQAGQIDAALSTARGIEDAFWRAEALGRIAVAQVGAGQLDAATRTFDAALSAARGIEETGSRGMALHPIAAAQAEAGQLDAALTTARGIEDTLWRAEALGQIAVAQAEAGQFEVASSTARGIENPSSRIWALGRIVAAQVEAGQLEAALTIVQAMWVEGAPLAKLASAYAGIAAALASRPTEAGVATTRFPLLSQKALANYRDPAFRDLPSTTASGERPVWQLACLAAVYAMLERGRDDADAMIDDWFADPRAHGGRSPGALRPAYVGGDVALDTARLIAELGHGRPVILRAVGGPLGQHFVLAVGVEDGTVTALDPWPGQNAPDDAPGQKLRIPLGDGRPAHPLIPGLVFTDMRLVTE